MLTQADHDALMDREGILSFDYLVEQGGVSDECAKDICDLGYYGKPITKQSIKDLNDRIPFENPKFGFSIHAMDGVSLEKFDTLEELAERAQGYRGSYAIGKHTASDEGTRISLIGATWDEVGMEVSHGFLRIKE